MKPRNPLHVLTIGVILTTGCTFGEKRTEIRGNGQGGVEVEYVPNDRSAEPSPKATPQNATAEGQTREREQQQQIEQLQSQVRQQDEEIRRLKGLPATQPSTQP